MIPALAKYAKSQQDLIRDAMLSAHECRTWYTLRELAKLTGFGEASISAQLRHLRASGFVLSKKHRGRLWEYDLRETSDAETRG